jgi:hypothetical protein
MEENPVPLRSMGRPPLNVKSTHIRLDTEMFERIDRVLRPKEKMADLVRKAVAVELEKREAVERRRKQGRRGQ